MQDPLRLPPRPLEHLEKAAFTLPKICASAAPLFLIFLLSAVYPHGADRAHPCLTRKTGVHEKMCSREKKWQTERLCVCRRHFGENVYNSGGPEILLQLEEIRETRRISASAKWTGRNQKIMRLRGGQMGDWFDHPCNYSIHHKEMDAAGGEQAFPS